MKSIIFVALMFLGLNSFAQGHDHSGTVCSADHADLCLHLGIHNRLGTDTEGKFMVHFLVDEATANKIENLQVVLWMDMGNGNGHGTAPVTVTQKGPGKYMVSNAWFVMEGEWLVKVAFTFEGQNQEIVVPVEIK